MNYENKADKRQTKYEKTLFEMIKKFEELVGHALGNREAIMSSNATVKSKLTSLRKFVKTMSSQSFVCMYRNASEDVVSEKLQIIEDILSLVEKCPGISIG